MIKTLTFASCYVYSPRGTQQCSERSRLLRALLKAADANFLPKYSWRVREQSDTANSFAEFFEAAAVLMPVPGSAPRVRGGLWVAERLAAELVRERLGQTVWPGLKRIRAVRKSSTAPAGARPSVEQHYNSFAVEQTLAVPAKVILIDDVVTKGRTLLAAAMRVQEAFPQAQIRAFAMVRTLGLVPEVGHLLEPCIGEIKWIAGDAHRTP